MSENIWNSGKKMHLNDKFSGNDVWRHAWSTDMEYQYSMAMVCALSGGTM